MSEYKECEACPGYCCLTNSELFTPLTTDDILRIAQRLKIHPDNFAVFTNGRMRYTTAPNAIAHIKSVGPCPFLRDGLCGINDIKPQACREAIPVHLDPKISCAEYYKLRVGLV